MRQKERIFLSPPQMNGTEICYINKAFETNWIAPLGANVDELEARMETYLPGQKAVALSSGTAGIPIVIIRGDLLSCLSASIRKLQKQVRIAG